MNNDKIGVIGLGVMGGGIAQMLAEHDKQVLVWDIDQAALERGVGGIRKRLDKSAEKGSLTPERAAEILANLTTIKSLDGFAEAGLVIEAVVEKTEAKQAILAPLSRIVAAEAIIGTNTSSLSITDLAAACQGPQRFLGIHFFNPPTKLELVEVVPTAQTSPEVLQCVCDFLRGCGKTPVVAKDSPGFIVNRLLLLMINEAARMVDQGVASAEDIDTAMRLGALHPAGPLAVADLIGLDTCANILRILQQGIGESSYEPADAIQTRVESGKLGRKSGEGFYASR